MKKYGICGILIVMTVFLFTGCAKETETVNWEDAISIQLSDESVTVNGTDIATDSVLGVYVANDIVFYPKGKDFTFGEGEEADVHSQEEADKHRVVHITEAGTYALSGELSAGQIAVDLGEDAKDDKDAVVTLVLQDVDITCTVAPAVIFYSVYECGDADTESATKDVETTLAGANVVIADNTENNISGSYVAKIYESVQLNQEGTEVLESKKLHKYDGAFYSKMSMNIYGGVAGSGVLNIYAENEGVDSELHLTIGGGNINIVSGDDGINTNEDGVSVTTINGGNINICVTGEKGEGDGIDSNGWLVVNGGNLVAEACSESADAGIDSDMGIYINGGTVIANGNMLDAIEESEQTYAVFQFDEVQKGGSTYILQDEEGKEVLSYVPRNDFTVLIIADDALKEGNYVLQKDGIKLSVMTGIGGGQFGGKAMPEGMEKPEDMERPEGGEMPKVMERPEGGEMPEGMERPEGGEMPEGMERPEGGEMPEGMERPEGGEMPKDMEKPEGGNMPANSEAQEIFQIVKGSNYFQIRNTDRIN